MLLLACMLYVTAGLRLTLFLYSLKKKFFFVKLLPQSVFGGGGGEWREMRQSIGNNPLNPRASASVTVECGVLSRELVYCLGATHQTEDRVKVQYR